MTGWIGRLFQTDGTIGRGSYARVGLALALVKYVAETVFVYGITGASWTPWAYLTPLWLVRSEVLQGLPPWSVLALGLWTLPFLWVGINLTRKRALDAGRSPWVSLLFVVPVLNYALILWLCLAPTRRGEATPPPSLGPDAGTRPIAVATLAALLGIGAGAVAFFASVHGLGSYGLALFVGAPFLQGVVTGAIMFERAGARLGQTYAVTALSVLVACGALLLGGIEGLICIAMAFPLVLPVALLGAFFGYGLARSRRRAATTTAALLIFLPGAAGLETQREAETFEVVSSIVVDAPPEQVWPRVVSVSELPPPTEWLFHSGIAYPQRARIEGSGVGAVRYCEFSTGPFVEPITAWDAPRRLAFDVVAHPRPMTEWSPYRDVAPPHLDDYFESVRGEFRLVTLEDGRTRLEGSTWYELRIFPAFYWRLWADRVVGAIHDRVLLHIRNDVARPPHD